MNLDVTMDLISQLHGVHKAPSTQGASLRLRESTHDCVELGHARWGEVHIESSVNFQLVSYVLGFVNAADVQNQTQSQAGIGPTIDLLEKGEKLLCSIFLRDSGYGLSRRHIESSVQAAGPVSLVAVGFSFDLSQTKRQYWLRAISGLNLILVNNGKYHCILWKIQDKAHRILHFLNKLGIVPGKRILQLMGFQIDRTTGLTDLADANAGCVYHRSKIPMCRLLGSPMRGQLQKLAYLAQGDSSRPATASLILRTIESSFSVSTTPALDCIYRESGFRCNLKGFNNLGIRENAPRSIDQALQYVPAPISVLNCLRPAQSHQYFGWSWYSKSYERACEIVQELIPLEYGILQKGH